MQIVPSSVNPSPCGPCPLTTLSPDPSHWLPPHRPEGTVSSQVSPRANFLPLLLPGHSLVFFLPPVSSFRSLLKCCLLRVAFPDHPLMSTSAPFLLTFVTLIIICSSPVVHLCVMCVCICVCVCMCAGVVPSFLLGCKFPKVKDGICLVHQCFSSF